MYTEAILANRPVITSPVCPALADIREAAIEVQPDDIDQYCEAILKLSDDPIFYESKRLACVALQEAFYNPKNSWGSKFEEVVNKIISGPTCQPGVTRQARVSDETGGVA